MAAGENPQPWTPNTLANIQNYAATIKYVSAAITNATGINVTPLQIAAPVAREMNKAELDYPEIIGPGIRELR